MTKLIVLKTAILLTTTIAGTWLLWSNYGWEAPLGVFLMMWANNISFDK